MHREGTHMKIEVLGSGCARCNELTRVTEEAVAKAGVDAEIEHVTDMGRIVSYGVMATPALVIDGEVRLSGRIPKVDDLVALLGRA